MPPFTLFSPKAQAALQRAHELANDRGQSQVVGMHLLLEIYLKRKN